MNKEQIQAVIEKEAMRVHPERPGKHWVRTLTDAQRKSFIAGGTFVLATLPVSEVKSGESMGPDSVLKGIAEKEYPYNPSAVELLENITWETYINHQRIAFINGLKFELCSKEC